MTFLSQETISRLKSQVNNRKPLRSSTSYSVDGEEACRETFVIQKTDKSAYVVGHDDYLEKFFDVPDLHFKYERNEFEKFEDAISFAIEKYGFDIK